MFKSKKKENTKPSKKKFDKQTTKPSKDTVQKIIEKKGYNPELISQIQPQGGISFKDEKFIKIGDGYETTIHIYEFPSNVDEHWLATLVNIQNVISVTDIKSEDMNKVRQYINKGIKEHLDRYKGAKKATDEVDAQQRANEIYSLYEDISVLGEIIKLIHIRLYVSGRTLDETDKSAKAILSTLEGYGYKATILINEQFEEWLAKFLPYSKQEESKYARYGQPVTAECLAGGNPFHFTSLQDPCGGYLGNTDTGGSVLFDMFEQNNKRLSYNGIAIGSMGSGKSTTLKKILHDRAILGDFIRCFDVTGEYTDLVEHLGGKIISLDGSNGVLNALEVLKTDELEETCFARHLNKLKTIYILLSPKASTQEVIAFETLLRNFYVEWGLIPIEVKPSKLENEEINYDEVLNDFTSYERKIIKMLEEQNKYENIDDLHKDIAEHFDVTIEDIELISNRYNKKVKKFKKAQYKVIAKEKSEKVTYQVTGLPSTAYPIWSDFLAYVTKLVDEAEEKEDKVQNQLAINNAENHNNVKLVIENIVRNYGHLFDGHTSIDNILNTQLVCFNIASLKSLKTEVFDTQIFLAQSLWWDNCVRLGAKMKRQYEKKEIDKKDVIHFLGIIDEAHTMINANKTITLEQLLVFSREARKYFGGLLFATQSIRDFVPENADSAGVEKIKALFELAQYKFILRQDSNSIDVISDVFKHQLTPSELANIPRLEKGECILAISGDRNIKFNVQISDEENELFAGGA